MAKKVEVTVTCDLEHPEGEAEALPQPVTFTFDNQRYELDTCARHHKEIGDAFGTYTSAGRRVAATARSSYSPSSRPAGRRRDRISPAAARAWLQSHESELPFPVGKMGRIPDSLMDIYEARDK